MGIRDFLNDKFGWSRKTASLTLIIRGAIAIIIFIATAVRIGDTLGMVNDVIVDLWSPSRGLHHKNHESINTLIMLATRFEQLCVWIIVQLLDIVNFFPLWFSVSLAALLFYTIYKSVIFFSEDASAGLQKSNE